MSSAQEDSSHEVQLDTTSGRRPESIASSQYRNSFPYDQLHRSPSGTNATQPVSEQVRQSTASKDPITASRYRPTTSQLLGDSVSSPITTWGGRHLDQNHAGQLTLPPIEWTSGATLTPTKARVSPFDDGNNLEVRRTDWSEPDSKRHKLSDDGWIKEALKRGQEERGAPDPYPMPQLTPSGQPWDSHAHSQTVPGSRQSRVPSNTHWLSPPGFSPTVRSAVLPRRRSSAYSSSSPSHSPACTHKSTTPASRPGPPSSNDGSVMGGFADLELGSRANSGATENVDSDATFSRIHDVPRVELLPRETTDPSKLEQLPKKIFMRIMMHCGYKAQVLLKKCNYNLYLTVDLDAVPWQEKTSTILFEEQYNPINFPRKSTKPQEDDVDGGDGGEGGEGGDGGNGDEQVDNVLKATKRKQRRSKAGPSSPSRTSSKSKAHIDTFGKWGCYSCYKILPAHYFEGALLEDKDGRTPKSNKLRGLDTAESDKKVDMRVEYIQIIGTVRGSGLPDWLLEKNTNVHATDVESYLQAKNDGGVDCDDLREYYKSINRDTHLVAPIRGVTPAFTPSKAPLSTTSLDLIANQPKWDSTRNLSPFSLPTPLPASQTQEDGKPFTEDTSENSRPFYKLQAENATPTSSDIASYTYQIPIPSNAERDARPLLLPQSEPVSRIQLPSKHNYLQEPTLEAGDMISLRRICIPCGTKFAIYRRDCNRKIISKTDEQWWVCDCLEVRLAGRSTGCSTCGRKVIY